MSIHRIIVTAILAVVCIFINRAPVVAQDADAVGTISGQVRNSATTDGIPSATVTLLGIVRGAVGDDEGRFTITGVPFGTYQIRASAFGCQSSIRTDIVVSGSRPVEVIFELNEQDVELAQVDVFPMDSHYLHRCSEHLQS